MHPIFTVLSHRELVAVADAVNPALTIVLLAAIWAKQRADASFARRRFVLQTGLSLLMIYVLAHGNRWFHLWPSHFEFPSGHMSYAAGVCTALWYLRPRGILIWVPLLAAYGALIVALGYHIWLDILGAWMLAPFVVWLCHRPGQVTQSTWAAILCGPH